MNGHNLLNSRRLSIAAFSFSFAYLLSFLFEGQVLYSLLKMHGVNVSTYILAAIIAHFMGLFTCGLFVRSRAAAKNIMFGGMGVCLVATVPFFLLPPHYGWADCLSADTSVAARWQHGDYFSGPLRPRTSALSPAQMS